MEFGGKFEKSRGNREVRGGGVGVVSENERS